jgi:hypothetical protein
MKGSVYDGERLLAAGVNVLLNEHAGGSWDGEIDADVALFINCQYRLELEDGRSGQIVITRQPMLVGTRRVGTELFAFEGKDPLR